MHLLARRVPARRRRGAALVLFALLVFGLMGLAALVIDLGMASATQGQMQAAVDHAALEAMRWRNTRSNGTPDYLDQLPFVTENFRRANAAAHVQLSFDDDLDPTKDDMGVSVGPDFELQGGIGAANASALIVLGTRSELDDPRLQVNQGTGGAYNDPSGDMLAGSYDSADALHAEAADGSRTDFVPASSATLSSDAGAFLVRMRRSGETPVAGVRAPGPAIPFLFGHGSLMGASADWDPRNEGLAVRATAISTAQPALQVGSIDDADQPPGRPLRGVVPFALRLAEWNSIDVTINDPKCVEVLASGEIRLDGQPIGTFAGALTAVGQEVVPQPPPTPIDTVFELDGGWAPIYADVLGTPRVVGFGYVDLEETPACTGGLLSLSKRVSAVGSHNVSAVFPSHTDALTRAEWDTVFALRSTLEEPLLAPALSR